MVNRTKKIARAVNDEQIEDRKLEIVESCLSIYLKKGLKDTSIKDISSNLTFARSSVYNYYQTKEEIFLDLLKREYDLLNIDLTSILEDKNTNKDIFINQIANAFAKREVLMRIVSSSLNELELHSRYEFLLGFKRSYGEAIRLLKKNVMEYLNLDEGLSDTFVELFFPFMIGLPVYTDASETQIRALKEAGAPFKTKSAEEYFKDFIYNFIR